MKNFSEIIGIQPRDKMVNLRIQSGTMKIVNAHLALEQHVRRTKSIKAWDKFILVSAKSYGWTILENYNPDNVDRAFVLNASESDKTVKERIDILKRMDREGL